MSSNLIIQLKTPLKRGELTPIQYIAGKMYPNTEEGFIVFNIQLPGLENPVASVIREEDFALVSMVNDDIDLQAALADNEEFLFTVEVEA
jgi:hypothetical protein